MGQTGQEVLDLGAGCRTRLKRVDRFDRLVALQFSVADLHDQPFQPLDEFGGTVAEDGLQEEAQADRGVDVGELLETVGVVQLLHREGASLRRGVV